MYNNFSQFSTFSPMSSYSQIAGQFGQQNMNQYFPNQTTNSNITFVNGMEGAKAFQMSPNSSVVLMDSENSKFYVKRTDNLGVAKISSYVFSEEEVSHDNFSSPLSTNNISQQTVEEITKKLSDLESRFNNLNDKLAPLLNE